MGLIECDLALLLLCSSRNDMWERIWQMNNVQLCSKPQILSANSAAIGLHAPWMYVYRISQGVYFAITTRSNVRIPALWSCKQRAVRFTTLIPDSPHPSVLALPCQPPCLHVETSGWLRDVTGMLLGFGQSRESGCTRFRITRFGVQVWVAISVVVFEKLSMQDLQLWRFWKRRWHSAAVRTSHLVWVWCTPNGVTLILYSVKCLLIRFLRERH